MAAREGRAGAADTPQTATVGLSLTGTRPSVTVGAWCSSKQLFCDTKMECDRLWRFVHADPLDL